MPKAILTAYEENAWVVVFGTGASQLKDGTKEGQVTIDHMLEHFDELSEFEAFNGINLDKLKKRMKEISIPETDSQNTKEEIEKATKIFSKKGINKIVLVSSPTHIPRCLRDAMEIFSRPKFASLMDGLSAQPSHTYFAGKVIVVEPSHRNDRASVPLNKILKGIFQISKELMPKFGRELTEIIKRYRKLSK